MAPTLYMISASPPVRAVLITAKAIGLELNEKIIDFFLEEHLKKEFLRLNPQHTIPTLVEEDDFVVWDSHAILPYLVSKYAKDDALYPEDLKKRAIINQRLHFDSSVIFLHMRTIARSTFFHFERTIDPEQKKLVIEAYGFLEKFLQGSEWVAGDFLSIADYSLLSTVSTLNLIIPVEAEEYPNIVAWLQKCEALPECEANKKGLEEAAELFKARLSKE